MMVDVGTDVAAKDGVIDFGGSTCIVLLYLDSRLFILIALSYKLFSDEKSLWVC